MKQTVAAALLLLAMTAVMHVHAEDFMVDVNDGTAQDSNGCGLPPYSGAGDVPCQSLEWCVVDRANMPGDRCILAPGVYHESAEIIPQVTQTNLTIIGAGKDQTILDFGTKPGLGSAIYTSFTELHLKDLTIRNSTNTRTVDNQTGCVNMEVGGSITRVRFEDCTATTSNGCVHLTGGVDVTDVEMIRCTAGVNAGAAYVGDMGQWTRVTIEDALVTGSGPAAGLQIATTSGATIIDLVVRNARLRDPANSGIGGAVTVFSSTVTLENALIERNFAPNGAGIYNSVSTITLRNSEIRHNLASVTAAALDTSGTCSYTLINTHIHGHSSSGTVGSMIASAIMKNSGASLSIDDDSVIHNNWNRRADQSQANIYCESGCFDCNGCGIGGFCQPNYHDFASQCQCYLGVGGQMCTSCAGAGMGFDDDVLECVTCPAGTYSKRDAVLDIDRCVPCPAGTFSAATGATGVHQCLPCGLGTSTNGLAGADACNLCPAGMFAPQLGSGICSPCPGGTSTGGSTGASACTACTPETFAASPGSPTCTPCTAGLSSIGSGGSQCTNDIVITGVCNTTCSCEPVVCPSAPAAATGTGSSDSGLLIGIIAASIAAVLSLATAAAACFGKIGAAAVSGKA